MFLFSSFFFFSCFFCVFFFFFFFSSRRRHTRYWRDWSSDVCSSDLRREVARVQRMLDRTDDRAAGGLDDVGRVGLQRLSECVVGGQEVPALARSEERRVGKECRSRWSPDQ